MNVKERFLLKLGVEMYDKTGTLQDYPVKNVSWKDGSWVMLPHPWVSKGIIQEQAYLLSKGVRSCFYDTVYIGPDDESILAHLSTYMYKKELFYIIQDNKLAHPNIKDIYGFRYKWMANVINDITKEPLVCLSEPLTGMLLGYSFFEIDRFFKQSKPTIFSIVYSDMENDQEVFQNIMRYFLVLEGREMKIHYRNKKDIAFKVNKRKMQRNLALQFHMKNEDIHDYFEQEMQNKYGMWCVVVRGDKSSLVTLFEYKWMMLLFHQVVNDKYDNKTSYYITAKLFGYSDEHIDSTINRINHPQVK